MKITKKSWLFTSVLAVMLSGCGGGGGNSAPAPVTPPVSQANRAPVAAPMSDVSIVTEGQAFVLDGSGSSDADRDALTYAWVQKTGTPVELSNPSGAIQNITSILLESDETLEFELTVSDGELSDVKTVSVSVENIASRSTWSEPIPYETGDFPLRSISSLSAIEDNGYRVFWHRNSRYDNGGVMAYRDFAADGTPSGEQVNAQLDLPSVDTTRVAIDVIKSGSENYFLHALSNFRGFAVSRGLPEGDFSADIIIDRNDRSVPTPSVIDNVHIGSNQLLSLVSGYHPYSSNYYMDAYIFEADGTFLKTTIVGPTRENLNNGVVTSFSDNSYLALWEQGHGSYGNRIEIWMQKANSAGFKIGLPIQIAETSEYNQIKLAAATLTNGNVMVAWREQYPGLMMKGRVIGSNGEFVTDEFVITETSESGQLEPTITALNTDQALVSWHDRRLGDRVDRDGDPIAEEQIRAIVYNSDGTIGSNEFLIAEGELADDPGEIKGVTLSDNRVILAWDQDEPHVSPLAHSVGFYPVGKK